MDEVSALRRAHSESLGLLKQHMARIFEIDRRLSDYQELLGERAALQGQVAGLSDEVRGLELALARREGRDPEATAEPNGWTGLSRPEAVERVLKEAGHPLSPTEITERLVALRPDKGDRRKGVSVALMRLERRAAVRKGSRRGLWELNLPSNDDGLFAEGGDRMPPPDGSPESHSAEASGDVRA